MSRTLLEQWKDIAYDESADRATLQRFWGTYFQIEKEIYEQLLSNPDEEVKGTVKELAEKYGQEVLTMVGFLDGIDESLKEPNPIETMDEDTVVSLAFDKEKLYKNMVAAKAAAKRNLSNFVLRIAFPIRITVHITSATEADLIPFRPSSRTCSKGRASRRATKASMPRTAGIMDAITADMAPAVPFLL